MESARAVWGGKGGGRGALPPKGVAAGADLDREVVADEERVLDLTGFGHHPAIVHGNLLRVPSACVGVVVVVELLRRRRWRRCDSAHTGPAIEARPRVSWTLHPQ